MSADIIPGTKEVSPILPANEGPRPPAPLVGTDIPPVSSFSPSTSMPEYSDFRPENGPPLSDPEVAPTNPLASEQNAIVEKQPGIGVTPRTGVDERIGLPPKPTFRDRLMEIRDKLLP